MGSGHAHTHGHEPTWTDWRGTTQLRVIVGTLAAAALLTVVGLIALWPGGDTREETLRRAEAAGLPTERYEAEVLSVLDRPCGFEPPADPDLVCRFVDVVPKTGPDEGVIIVLDFVLDGGRRAPTAAVGDDVILGRLAESGFTFFVDEDRRGTLMTLAALFAVIVVAFSRIRGVLALLSLVLTVLVLTVFVAPSVLDGNDPVLVCVVAASVIAFVTLYLTHGFSPTTTIALFGTLSALALTLGVSWIFFERSRFSGLETEGGPVIPALAGNLNLSSLLLGGAIIGTLGALDDITVTQVSTVSELRMAEPNQSRAQLIGAAIRIGRAHIASTVNTLVLAYVGAAMPLLLIFDATRQTLGLAANSESIAVEIVRTLCGSIGLVAAVPLTTALAATLVSEATVCDDEHEHDHVELDQPPKWDDFAPEADD